MNRLEVIASFDGLTAYNIIKDVTRSMKYWQLTALDCGISSNELQLFSDRFEEGVCMMYDV